MRRAGFSATTRKGIKNTSSPAGNVGERARRRPSQRGFRSGLSAPSTPWLGRFDRPSSIVAPNRNITEKKSATSSAAAAPPRRPEQVEMRRAGFSATTRKGIKNTSSPAGNVGERARRRPSQRGFRSGLSAPSTPWLGRFDRPSSIVAPNRNITEKKSATSSAAAAPPRRPEQVEMRRAGFSATTRKGIKNTSSPAGNVGERARRRPSQRGFRSGLSAPSTPWLGRFDRPSSIVAPNRNITEKKSATSSAAAAPPRRPEQVEMRRAGFSATTRKGIKNTSSPAGNVGERARRRPSQRGFRSGLSAPSTPWLGRFDRPSSIVAPNRNITEKKSATSSAAAAPPRRPEQVEMRRAGFSATTRKGIKNTSSPAGNVGERARRRPSQRGFRSGLSAPSTPWLGRFDRPSSIVAPNRNITEKKSATSSAAAAPPRRPEQVEMRRAGFSATTRKGIKNTSSPAGNVGERARRRPSQRGFRSGLSAPSTPWLGRFDRPSSIVAPNRNITEKKSATSSAAAAPPRRPEQVEMRRAGFSATTRKGIKNTSSPAGNVGERARRRPSQRGFRSGLSAPSTPWLGRFDRPSSIVAPNRNITEKKSATSSAAAAPPRRPEQVEMRRAGFSATTRKGIKNTSSPAGNVGERARRRPSQRGFRSGLSAPSTPWLGRFDRPSSIVAPNRNITEKKSATSSAAAAPPRRPEQVEMRRAGFSATTRKGIKNTSSPAGNVGERARRRPSQRGFRSGLSAPSTPWLGRFDRPSSIVAPNRNITEKKSATSSAAAAPPRRPEQVEMRRAGFSATTRKGIKNTSSPAGNVGERARRRPSQRGFRSGLSAPSTPWLGRFDRPSSIVAPNRNITEKKSATSSAAAAPPRRPEQVEMRRAGFSATTRKGIKNTSSPAGNVGERARRRPSQRGFRSGLSAPSTPWLGRFDRPSSIVAPNRNITEKKSATSSAAAAPPRRPEQVEMRRAGFSATTRKGIKNTSSPAGNVGERARRRPSQRGFRSGLSAPSTPWLGRFDRPSSIVAPNRNITEKKSATSSAAAAPPRRPEQVEMRRAGFSATTRKGIKNTSSPAGNVGERARRRPSQRGFRSGLSAPSTPWLGRFDRPSSIVAPNRNITEKKSATSSAAAAPPRRPEQVEMRRAGFSATTRKGIKNTSSPAGNVGERARRRPSQRGFRSGLSAPSTPWLGRFDRPSSIVAPNRNITEKKSATSSAAAAPPRRPEQVEMRRAGFSATTRKGIKNTSSPADVFAELCCDFSTPPYLNPLSPFYGKGEISASAAATMSRHASGVTA